jgi:hypothetical protein
MEATGDPVNGIMTLPWLCFAARGIALRALWAVEQDPRLASAGTVERLTIAAKIGV